jgi:hypothetical protein
MPHCSHTTRNTRARTCILASTLYLHTKLTVAKSMSAQVADLWQPSLGSEVMFRGRPWALPGHFA